MPTKTPPKSSIYRTADRKIGNLPEWLATQRAEGCSFGVIASLLQDKNVLTTGATVRSWCIRLGIEDEA